MKNDYYLFIDETGTTDPKHLQSQLYILCGCSVLNGNRNSLKIRADQIKFKYWGGTNIVFHSVEISRNDGDFRIFRNNSVLKAAFLKDLLSLLSWAPLMINCVVIDKVEAKKKGWIQKDKFIKETSYSLLKNFILMTCAKGKVKGKIMIESSSEKDPYYLKAFNHYLANGIKDTQVTQTDVKKALTSMTFVTKNNHDIESQLADLFAYAAKCQYLHSTKSKKVKKGSYEEKLVKIFDRKLYSMDPKVSTKKQTLLKKVTSFLVLP